MAGYTLIAKYVKTIAKNEKCILSGVFCVTLFVFCAPFFAFRILCQCRHSSEKSKDFVVYFFAVLIKHEIRIKYEKCIESVSYFVMCFRKTFAKYEKCIASLTEKNLTNEPETSLPH